MAVVVRLHCSTALIAMLFAAVSAAPMGSMSIPKPHGSEYSGSIASDVFYPEVHLRKLHLVRPDLIPYPIYYEIYC